MIRKIRSITNKVLLMIHLIIGIGGLFGGYAALSDPKAPLGIPAEEALKNSPFSDFLIPGIILFVFLGLGNVIFAILPRFLPMIRGYGSSVFGFGLMVWIIVQFMMLRTVVSLHVIFFIFGMIQATAGIYILYQENQFPMPFLTKLMRKLKNQEKKSQI
jgi:hypothetical protein